MAGQSWSFIEDLPDNWRSFASTELAALTSIWREQSGRLIHLDAFHRFNQRLCREWAIETGVIENLYTLDRGITQLLIEKGIEASLIPHGATDRPAEMVVALVQDQEEVLEGLFDFVAQRRSLSTSYIKQLHQIFTRHQQSTPAIDERGHRYNIPLLKGTWKERPNNPVRPGGEIHEYTPPEHVAAEMDRLMEMIRNHRDVPPEVDAAWLHHRFTQIHPFQDGNGRVARALASLVFLRAGWFPLVIDRDHRDIYIDALEAADRGDLEPLVLLFSHVQKTALLQALSISHDVLRDSESLSQVIASAVDRLRSRQEPGVQKWKDVFQISRSLEQQGMGRLREIQGMLSEELKQVNPAYDSIADESTQETADRFNHQIVELSRGSGYYADTRSYRAWIRLQIQEERHTQIVITFHALGVEFLGVMAATGFLEYRHSNGGEETSAAGPYPLSQDIFQFTYNEETPFVMERFGPWLNNVLLIGLDQWRRQL